MARLNRPNVSTARTHEGAPARIVSPELMLRRSVLSCLLWEDTFYEDGISIADRIAELVAQVDGNTVKELSKEARTKFKLRHVPLLLLREAVKNGVKIADALEYIIQRPDELAEFLAIYWANGKQPLAAQVKKGLARAFTKFDEYSLAKYNRDNAVKLRDVLFLVHAKPKNAEQAALWKRLIDNTLKTPDTWEVNLSGGADKKKTFERLLRENKLGALALLRNLRNMVESGVDEELVAKKLIGMNASRVLPFRFITAEKYAPRFSRVLETKLFESVKNMEKLEGKTAILVDVSGSMMSNLSSKSVLKRYDAAASIAMLLNELTDASVFVFNNSVEEIPARRGFALRDKIAEKVGGGTYLGKAINYVQTVRKFDRLIVLTDEQSADRIPVPTIEKSYMINVASYKNGIGYKPYVHIDGFSEAVIQFITEYEKEGFAAL